jgi:Spy/CpxP family protein refolding chaperone
MKSRWMIWTLAFSAGLNVALVAAIATGWTQPDPPKPMAQRPLPVGRRLLQVSEDKLALTAEQHVAFQEILDRWDAEERRQRLMTLERMWKVSSLMASGELSPEVLAPIFEAAREGSTNFTERLLEAFREQRTVLTPEQNKVYSEILERRWKYIQGELEENLKELNRPPDSGPPVGATPKNHSCLRPSPPPACGACG